MRELKTVVDLLDALREKHGYTSDNQIAQAVGVPQTTVSTWRRGRSIPTDTHALRIAEALEVSPALVLTIAAAERSDDEETRKAWSLVARHLARAGLPAFAALLISAGIFSGNADAQPESAVRDECILRKIRRRGPKATETPAPVAA